ncbi:type II secretion system protein [Candidatus Saccharibacteria bacterium]|nr:type II secretion system protein [Candidatus Saccharibacteria bacterium]
MTKNKKGFTIIEVVLVLAIAGLIFLMVFIALPALQRSQRNTQREDDISRFLTAANDYQTNNSGKTPFVGTATTNFVAGVHKNFVSRYIDKNCTAGTTAGTYTGCESEFTDPDGTIYRMQALMSGAKDGVFGESVEFGEGENNKANHTVQAVVNATCGDENTAIAGTGTRQYALFYMLEGNSVTCNDNH